MTVLSSLESFGLSLAEKAKISLQEFLADFIADDLGKLAVDAVAWAETEVDGSGDDKKEQAKTKFLNDAEAAGEDMMAAARKDLNFMIETALQAVSGVAITKAIAG